MKNSLNVKKAARVIFSLNLIQLASLIGILASYYFTHNSIPLYQLSIFLIVIFITLCINCLVAVRKILNLRKINLQSQMLLSSLQNVENLNNTLRAQRHDFLNHLQVVYGLIEIDEYEHVKKYIEKVYVDIQKVNMVLKTSVPAVNALLQAKTLYCEKNSIKIGLEITSRLEGIKVPSWELCRVLGNLIDNAVNALSLSENKDKNLLVKLTETLKSFDISVIDNGVPIPSVHQDELFKPGFTTRKNLGEGMGLAIVKDIAVKYGGKVFWEVNEAYKRFCVSVPKEISST